MIFYFFDYLVDHAAFFVAWLRSEMDNLTYVPRYGSPPLFQTPFWRWLRGWPLDTCFILASVFGLTALISHLFRF